MLTLLDVFEWIKVFLAENVNTMYCGFLNVKENESVGVYNNKNTLDRIEAIGKNTETQQKNITLLIHGNESSADTNTLASSIYTKLRNASGVTIGGHDISYIDIDSNEAIDVGMDENSVFEYVINFNIYYKK